MAFSEGADGVGKGGGGEGCRVCDCGREGGRDAGVVVCEGVVGIAFYGKGLMVMRSFYDEHFVRCVRDWTFHPVGFGCWCWRSMCVCGFLHGFEGVW